MKRIVAALLALALLCAFSGTALAESSILGDDFVLDLEPEATPTPAPTEEGITVRLDGTMPRPGEKPATQILSVSGLPSITFPSPFASGRAMLSNDEAATMIVVYVLRVSVEEVLKKTGRSGYPEEEYQQMLLHPAFDPAAAFITLSQTKGVLPGKTVEEITLGTLPDGTTLPSGVYEGRVVMVPFSVEDQRAEMVQVEMNISFTIEDDTISVILDEHYAVPVSVFNPIDAEEAIRFSVLISQDEIEKVSGSAHRTAEELAAQARDPLFSPGYEFITLFTSDLIEPGAFLERIQLTALPDGEPLPSGAYMGWLARLAPDPQSGQLVIRSANTQIQIVVP